MNLNNRAQPNAVALETTLLVHGVPTDSSLSLNDELSAIVSDQHASPTLIGVLNGTPTIGMNPDELRIMLEHDQVMKANTANLGVALHTKAHAATTVSTTMELAATAGIKVFATGGIGGVHKGYDKHLDISSDLAAFTRFPVAVVTSGVKSILDVVSTREALESLGILVVGYQTDSFPAFYLRESEAGVDVRIDDPDELASLVDAELERTARGIVIANPIPSEHELDLESWNTWLSAASAHANSIGATGRSATPAILGKLHEVSNGATLRANIELVKSNAKLAGMIASRLTKK
ncbi:MAG: pseudouridine-5'-phosphate glycosidase [Phycisphaerales bacterium]|nr:pseudouridine-5'-phosphate glycosidase [Phycisphaerales bacterium]